MAEPRMKILFANPIFGDSNPNFTIRLGEKWYYRLTEGQKVDLAHTDGKVVASATVSEMYLYSFDEIPARVLAHEHDPKCHSPQGLFDVLASVYAEQFKEYGIQSIDDIWDKDLIYFSCIGLELI